MRNLKTATILMISFCCLVFLITLLDFAALHDIRHEYVSQPILQYLGISLSGDLPEWTSTPGEWSLVTFSLFLRFLFLILNLILLIYLYKNVILKNNRT